MNGKERLLAFYLVIMLVWDAIVIGGCTYLVFWMDRSGWWYLLAILMCHPMSAVIEYTTEIDRDP